MMHRSYSTSTISLISALLLLMLMSVLAFSSQAQFDILDDCPTNPFAVAEMLKKLGSNPQANLAMVDIIGLPQSELPANTAEETGCFWHFEYGSIYYSSESGAHIVIGDIRGKYAQLGWELSTLGYPLSDELVIGLQDEGRVSYFQGGAIFWKPDHGAFAVYGRIWDIYDDLSQVYSDLGYPSSDELDIGTAFASGRYNQFEDGVIIWSLDTDAQALTGNVYTCWKDREYELQAEYFTFPTSVNADEDYAYFSRGGAESEAWIMWDGQCMAQIGDENTIYWTPTTTFSSIQGNLVVTPNLVPVSPTAVVTPEIEPSDIVCFGFDQPSRLNIGMTAEVTPGDPNNLRKEPETGDSILKVYNGTPFTVIDGPICGDANGLVWWEISVAGEIGWTAEGQDSEYWLTPIP